MSAQYVDQNDQGTSVTYEYDETAKGAVTLRLRVGVAFDPEATDDDNIERALRIYDSIFPQLDYRRKIRMGEAPEVPSSALGAALNLESRLR